LDQLMAVLEGILASEPVCPGDGTLDKTVNVDDVNGLVANWGKPSVFDFNNDGVTDQNDMQTLLNNYNDQCFAPVTGPVTLSINPAGGQMQIQWPNSTTPGRLQSSTQLSGTSVWNSISNAPYAIGYTNAVFLTPSNQASFFRVVQ